MRKLYKFKENVKNVPLLGFVSETDAKRFLKARSLEQVKRCTKFGTQKYEKLKYAKCYFLGARKPGAKNKSQVLSEAKLVSRSQ